MKYISVDLETTSLIPNPKHILMMSFVLEDTTKPHVPVEKLPHFTCFVDPEKSGYPVIGQPYALAMNGWILDIVSGRKKNTTGYPVHTLQEAFEKVQLFVQQHFPKGERPVLAGKNVGSFDLQFFPDMVKKFFHFKTLDPGSVFMDWSTGKVPGLQELKDTFQISGEVSHDAREDALDVIRVLRQDYEALQKKKKPQEKESGKPESALEALRAGEWVKTESSNVGQIKYNVESEELLVTFKKGGQYVYYDVPSTLAEDLVKAESVGSFLNKEVKGSYDYKKL